MRLAYPLLLALFATGLASEAAHADGRILYSTLVRRRVENTGSGGANAGLQRIILSFKNISTVEQNVEISIKDVAVTLEAQFSSPAAASAARPTWGTNTTYPEWKIKGMSPSYATENVTIGPLGAVEWGVAIKCDYLDSTHCTFEHGEPPGAGAPDVTGMVFNASFSVEMKVREDRGAVLCDLFTQTIAGGGTKSESEQETRPLNAGRPF